MTSILNDTKKLLGITPGYTQFDQDIIIHINSVINTLNQLGAIAADNFYISDSNDDWDSLIMSANENLIKTYIYLKVRLLFDPPQSSSLVEVINRQIAELEWRINVETDRYYEHNSKCNTE